MFMTDKLSVKSWAYLIYVYLLFFSAACTEVIPNISVNGSLSNGIWIRDPNTQIPQSVWILTKETETETIIGYCRPEISRLAVRALQTGNEWVDLASLAPNSENRCAIDGTFILRIPTNSGPFSFSADQDFEAALQIRGMTETKQASDWQIQMSYDADRPVLIVSAAENSVQAPGTLSFRYRLSRSVSMALTWDIDLNRFQAAGPSNFVSSFPSSVSIPANTTSEQTLSVPLIDPSGACQDEIVFLKTNSLDAARVSAEPSVFIRDNRPTIQLSEGSSLNVSESLGAIRFNVSLLESCQYPITLGYTISEGPSAPFARLGSDYSSSSPGNFFMSTIPAGQTSFEVISPLVIINDSIDEYDENMNLALNWAQDSFGLTASIGSFNNRPILILDDDQSPTLSLSLPSEVSELAGQFTAEFRLDRPTEKLISVPFELEVGAAPSAQVNGTTPDLLPSLTTIADFGLLQTLITAVFIVRDDDLYEPLLERFQIRAPVVTMAGLTNSVDLIATSAIRDNELPPVFSLIGPTEIIEGTNSIYKIRSSVKIQGGLSLPLTTAGTASSPLDYDLSASTITFFESEFDSSNLTISVPLDSESPEVESIILSGLSSLGPREASYSFAATEIQIIDTPPLATLNPFTILGVRGNSTLGADAVFDSSFNYYDPTDLGSTIEVSWTAASPGTAVYDISLHELDGTLIAEELDWNLTSFFFAVDGLGLIAGNRYLIRVTAKTTPPAVTLAAVNQNFEFLVNRPPRVNRNEIHTLSGNSVTVPLLSGSGVANLQGLDLDGDAISLLEVVNVDPLFAHSWSWTSSTLSINGGWDSNFNGPGVSRLRLRFTDSRGYEATHEILVRSYIQDSTWIGAVSSSWNDRNNWCGTVRADLSGCEPPSAAPTNRNGGSVFLNGDLSTIDTINMDSGLSFTSSAEIKAQKVIIGANSNLSVSRLSLGESATFNGNNRLIDIGELRLMGAGSSQKAIFNSTSATLKLRSLFLDSAGSWNEFNHNNGTLNFGPWFGENEGVLNWSTELLLNNVRYDFGNLEFRHELISSSVVRVLGSLYLNASPLAILNIPIVQQGTTVIANGQAPSDESLGQIRLIGGNYTISPISTNGVAALHRLELLGPTTLSIGNGSSSRLAVTREFSNLGTETASAIPLTFWQRGPQDLTISLRTDFTYPQIEIVKLASSSSADIRWVSSGPIQKLALQNLSPEEMRFLQFPAVTLIDELKWLSAGAGVISNSTGASVNLNFTTADSGPVRKITISGSSFAGGAWPFNLALGGSRGVLIEAPVFSRPRMHLISGLSSAAEIFLRGRLQFEDYTQVGSSLQRIRVQSDQITSSALSFLVNPNCTAAGSNFILQTYSPLGFGPQRSELTYPSAPAVPFNCTVTTENSVGGSFPIFSDL